MFPALKSCVQDSLGSMSTCSPLPGVLPTSGTAPLTPCSLQGDSWLSSPRRRLYPPGRSPLRDGVEPEAKFPSYPFEHMPLRDGVSTRRSPGLRPRWCPECSPWRIQDCCFPSHSNVSAFIPLSGTILLPQLYIFRGSIQSLHPCFLRLQTPLTRLTCGFCY